jgi:hypothetical protein
MAIRTVVNSAWEDIEDYKISVDGARESADYVRTYVEGAWEDAWVKGYHIIKSGKCLNYRVIAQAYIGTVSPILSSEGDNCTYTLSPKDGAAKVTFLIVDADVNSLSIDISEYSAMYVRYSIVGACSESDITIIVHNTRFSVDGDGKHTISLDTIESPINSLKIECTFSCESDIQVVIEDIYFK